MNIQEENSALYFRVQSEREQTFSFEVEATRFSYIGVGSNYTLGGGL